MSSACYYLCLIGFFRLNCYAAQSAWPMPESLVGLWPLDSESELRDIANKNHLSNAYAAIMTTIKGPFGQPNSSYTIINENFYIGGKSNIPLTPAITISFYYYTKAKGNGCIFMFFNGPRFVINYLEPNYLEIWRGPEKDGTLIGRYPILHPNSWNFVAITYNKTTGKLTIYDQNQNLLGSSGDAQVPTDPSTSIYVGHCYWGSGHVDMKTTDAIACLMLYNTTLTPSQIAELPYHCQTKGRGTTKAITTTKALPVTIPWPRPDSLLAFWPLNSQYNLNDINKNQFHGNPVTSPQFAVGPFGDRKTAMKPQNNNAFVLSATRPELAVNGSFTVALFLSIGVEDRWASGGIFEFLDTQNTPNAFQFRYENRTTIEVSANSNLVGHYTMVQQMGAWTFVAFVFDSSTDMLTVYGKHGMFSPPSFQPHIRSSNAFNNNGVRLGYATRWNQGLKTTDAVSCLMIYRAALTASEIRQVQDACRIAHSSSACGSPKLPFSPIPTSNKLTTIPRDGQFPYVGVVRFKPSGAICSATIIDAYWLLTSKQCFTASTNLSLCTVYVGEYDLEVAETHTRAHSCSKVILSGNAPRDIALVQVGEPIDFTNEYVNDACFYRRENADELKLDLTQFVVGWGKNGRSPLISQTLPRYAAGKKSSDDQCKQAWGSGDYIAGKDICFLSTSDDKNVPCSGDEGSPLLAQSHADLELGRGERLVQIGVYYKRDANCSQLKPPVFADLAEYTTWISEKIACAVPGVVYPDKCPQK